MKYIKELKGRKKGENIALKCKICKEKTFTATATLIYHYRSHAGRLAVWQNHTIQMSLALEKQGLMHVC
ncbi:hypothetical protein DPMN_093777 [Dreissena polymorpha]|uniref:C2H2-type domain-containing protein n=1 Tax=Dreissena polymorpha TaxID=45954 RepID=A0A9D4R285_DREPO|nr:hypothetical protein DPMN_093777 [Dreissena polymorpha]